jgi:hypothetical protein
MLTMSFGARDSRLRGNDVLELRLKIALAAIAPFR